MAIHTRLQKRRENGIYYCRVSVPTKLRALIGKREIHVSLKTSNALIARQRVRLESLKIDRMLAEANGKIDQMNIMGAVFAPISYAAPIVPPSISFLGLIERFMALPERAKLTDKGKLEYRVTFRLLSELFGESAPINTITRVSLLFAVFCDGNFAFSQEILKNVVLFHEDINLHTTVTHMSSN